MKINPKGVIAILIIMVFALSTIGAALAVEPSIEIEEKNWFTNLFSHGLYISGGSFTDDFLKQGEVVDAKIQLRFRVAGDRSRLILYWFNTDKGLYKNIVTKEYSYNSNVGSYITVTAKNLDTKNIPESWCGDRVKIAGVHEVRVDGVWKIDPKSTSELNKLGSWDATKSSISSNKVFTCKSVACTKEDKEPFCSGNNVYQKRVKTEDCSYTSIKLDSCNSDEKCSNAKCIPDKTATECTDFNYGCSGYNIVAICKTDNTNYKIDKDCSDSGLVCSQGECVSDKPIVKEKIIWAMGENGCEEVSLPEDNLPSSYFTTEAECSESIEEKLSFCETDPDAEICKNVEEEKKTFCELQPNAEICTGDGNGDTDITPLKPTFTDKVKDFYENQPMYFWSIVVMSLLIISGLIYLVIPERK